MCRSTRKPCQIEMGMTPLTQELGIGLLWQANQGFGSSRLSLPLLYYVFFEGFKC